MDHHHRHSSPSPRPRASSPRPSICRERSNSLPMVEALGCSTPEAQILLAEGRAAVNRRATAKQRRDRRNLSNSSAETTIFRPQDHLKYLYESREAAQGVFKIVRPEPKTFHHSRTGSNVTNGSTSTITGPTVPAAATHPAREAQSIRSVSPLWDYSANLAKFMQSQLSSMVPAYANVYPRSCPDPVVQEQTPPQSPNLSERPPVDLPAIIEMSPPRPHLHSTFSAWSSDTDSDYSPQLDARNHRKSSRASNFTPSILRFYENTSGSFLLTATPPEEGEQQQHPNAKAFSFPNDAAPDLEPPSNTSFENDSPCSTICTLPHLTSSSAPSFSSSSTVSYFAPKRQISLASTSQVRYRVTAAEKPLDSNDEDDTAMSPFEDRSLVDVHDTYVDAQNKVLVDGMSFDLVPSPKFPPGGMCSFQAVQTPC